MRSAVMQLLFANLSSFLVICVVFSTEMHTHTARIWPSEQHIEHQIEQLNCCCLRWPNMNSNETNHYITAYLLFLIRFHILAIIHVPCVCVCAEQVGIFQHMSGCKRAREREIEWTSGSEHIIIGCCCCYCGRLLLLLFCTDRTAPPVRCAIRFPENRLRFLNIKFKLCMQMQEHAKNVLHYGKTLSLVHKRTQYYQGW